MPQPRPEVLDFLRTRRSRSARTLSAPAPDRTEIEGLLEAAARSPDHGMLVPWRFLVLSGDALQRLARAVEARGRALDKPEGDIEKARANFANAPLIVAVVVSPKPSRKIPLLEQTLSAGAVCLSLLNAALASGWGANWITGWPAHDRGFLDLLGCGAEEFVAGFVHIGTETVVPAERERPDIAAITDWVSA
ncbi:MAG: nitroreductase [Alphaproteobacteria bacterium]|nr:MAG: nitroreductase [Alphaproteobacteria bacterium]